jgi:DNA-binding CsgD family transcriptional regulator
VSLVFAPYAAARLHDDADAIADAAEHAERIGMTTIAATFMRQAADVAALVDQRRAARLGRRAVELHRGLSLGGPYDAPDVVDALSRREREVAELAAAGCSSREIGERLFLSPRTVDNHLARAYDKLGIDGRDGLAEALRAP